MDAKRIAKRGGDPKGDFKRGISPVSPICSRCDKALDSDPDRKLIDGWVVCSECQKQT